jgi:hypothetical protein
MGGPGTYKTWQYGETEQLAWKIRHEKKILGMVILREICLEPSRGTLMGEMCLVTLKDYD